MFSRLNAKSRTWILLIAWILFTGLGVADTFDLSDDIVLPTALEQPALAPASIDERKPHASVLNAFLDRGDFLPLSLIRESDISPFFSIPFTRSDTPLYQRTSVFRI
jgi:hypothetical protein